MNKNLLITISLFIITLFYTFIESKVLFIYTILLVLIFYFIYMYIINLFDEYISKPIGYVEFLFNKIKDIFPLKNENLKNLKNLI